MTPNGDGTGAILFSAGMNNTGFSQFAVTAGPGPSVLVNAFLEGPYNNAGAMNDGLRSGGFLPNSEPYSSVFGHLGGGGGESVSASVFNTTGSHAIIDWVYLELRDVVSPYSVLYTRSALLQANGAIVDVDGTSAVSFDQAPGGNYYVAVRHRNHLGVMTGGAVSLNVGSATTIDFTVSGTSVYGSSPLKPMGGMKLAMYAGDANHDGSVNAVDVNTH